MLRSRRKVIGITLGDPAGVGPEVTARSLASLGRISSAEFVVIGGREIFRSFWPLKKRMPPLVAVGTGRHRAGRPTGSSARDSLLYLDTAIEMLKKKELDGLVTAPVSKEGVADLVRGFKGHTTYLKQAFNARNVEMLFAAPGIKLALLTRHIPLKEVSPSVTQAKVIQVVDLVHDFLRQRFSLKAPRIAVCGLNPHAGEGGQIGTEELRHIIPAIARLRKKGLRVEGPFAADTIFEPRNRKDFDLILTMYHDQGLGVLKSLYFDDLVNVTAGLPFVRTSPAHGTAFNIAGKDIASCGAMSAAIRLAVQLV
jgi:4-hydroxythreonine-4-phosphate dehydrogenase